MDVFAVKCDSPFGAVAIAAKENALFRIYLNWQDCPFPLRENTVCLAAADWMRDYFSGKQPAPDTLNTILEGTVFQKQIWELLRAIPYGQTVTYGELAAQVAQMRGVPKMSAQAVGQAVGANPLPVLIPCHRVVGAKGDLVGFTGGLHIKRWLLHHEGIL